MKNIIVAGATGYLGRFIIQELQSRQIPFKAIARSDAKLKKMGLSSDQIIKAEVTNPKALEATLDGMDVLISTVGITRQKDGLSYMEVDYQANKNLLVEAQKAGIQKFIYVSAIKGDQMRHLKIFEAKERFVDELKDSGLDYSIIRPNGFFSDMKDFLAMSRQGRVYLFGHGNYRLNPIHGADLAELILASVPGSQKEIEVGGPDILTQNEIADLAFQVQKKPTKIVHLPDWLRKLSVSVMRTFTSSKVYGPFEFFMSMLAQDNVAPRYGVHRLHNYFFQEADRIK